jgi:hypothetical protein
MPGEEAGYSFDLEPRDLAEGEFAFEDVVIEAFFRSELQGRAFRECFWMALPDDLSSYRDP